MTDGAARLLQAPPVLRCRPGRRILAGVLPLGQALGGEGNVLQAGPGAPRCPRLGSRTEAWAPIRRVGGPQR